MSLDKCSGHWILINFSLNCISDKKGKEMKMTAITYYDCQQNNENMLHQ
jgi:hypothetical protein